MSESPYLDAAQAPSRADVQAMVGAVLLEFGTAWCGHCRAARPAVEQALQSTPGVRHVRVEDGPGRPLGRSFRVTLWPTLVFLRDGQEVARLVRPREVAPVAAALAALLAAG